MSIVKMKRLRLLGMEDQRDELLKALSRLGCVEISEPELSPDFSEYSRLLKKYDGRDEFDHSAKKERLEKALDILNFYAPDRSSIFSAPKRVSFEALYDRDAWSAAGIAADKITDLDRDISNRREEISRLSSSLEALEPWRDYPVPLESVGSKSTVYMSGSLPSGISAARLEDIMDENNCLAAPYTLSSDESKNYVFIICHKDSETQLRDILSHLDFIPPPFSGLHGTAEENIKNLQYELSYNEKNIETDKKLIASFASSRDKLKLCIDRCSYELSQREAREKLLSTDNVFALEGWLSVPEEHRTIELLSSYCCAWELADPAPGDDVPVKLKNSFLTRPLNVVTEMYSLPAYDGIDPNPLIMPFFTIFFGIMYADLGYGIILTILGILGLIAIKREGTMRNMMGLLVLCGITTAFFGVMFGGFFGDFLTSVGAEGPVVDKLRELKLLDPMEQPMVILIGSMAIGVVHILFGMFIKACMLIRDGHPLDALFDVGSWWLLFAGIALGALGRGWYVALGGVAALILTQGRAKPTFFGKLMGGLASLYDITSYISDILSYTRLMALLLATSVIASVVNMLGSMAGPVFFVIIFIAGHGFNMAINSIGTYVHSARLQYLEFFGKFYKDGGRPFSPLSVNTKYVTVVKEEK